MTIRLPLENQNKQTSQLLYTLFIFFDIMNVKCTLEKHFGDVMALIKLELGSVFFERYKVKPYRFFD